MNESSALARHDGGRRAEWESMTAAAERIVLSADAETQQVLFVPRASGHVYSDVADAFWRTATSILGEDRDELPVLFFGGEAMNRFTRSREAIGVLITDRSVLVRDEPSGVFGKAVPREVPLYRGPDGDAASAVAIARAATATLGWDWIGQVLTGPMRADALQAVAAAITEVLARVGTTDGVAALPTEFVTASDVRGRVAELGLGSAAKYVDDAAQRKHFAKLAKVVPLQAGEQIAVTFTAATLAGAYGLVLTNNALRSRDLMEPAVETAWAGVVPEAIRLEKDALIVAPGQVHTVPSHLGETEREGLVTLLREVAVGAVTL